jgi:hypothetical protein
MIRYLLRKNISKEDIEKCWGAGRCKGVDIIWEYERIWGRM